jgi:hypothetical protein
MGSESESAVGSAAGGAGGAAEPATVRAAVRAGIAGAGARPAGAASTTTSGTPDARGTGSQPAGADPQLEPLGLVADPEQLAAQVAGALPEGAAGQPLSAADAAQAAASASWGQLTPPTVQVLACVVFPAWQIRPEEQTEISGALAECLEQVFPGGLGGRYACWIRLLVACGAITVSRVAMNGGKLPPLFLPADKAAVRAGSEPAAPASREPAPLRPEQLTSLGV